MPRGFEKECLLNYGKYKFNKVFSLLLVTYTRFPYRHGKREKREGVIKRQTDRQTDREAERDRERAVYMRKTEKITVKERGKWKEMNKCKKDRKGEDCIEGEGEIDGAI